MRVLRKGPNGLKLPVNPENKDYKPDPYMHRWCKAHLPDCRDYWITDVDMFVRDRAGNVMFVEIKRKMAEPNPTQRISLAILKKIFRAGLEQFPDGVPVAGKKYPLKFHGVHLLQMEGTTIEGGHIFWNGKRITRAGLIKRLSFQMPV